MRIVALDGYTLNPGDTSWQPVEVLGEFTVHDRTPTEEIVARSRDAEILLTNKTPIGWQGVGAVARPANDRRHGNRIQPG